MWRPPVVGGTTYLFVTGSDDDGVSVLLGRLERGPDECR